MLTRDSERRMAWQSIPAREVPAPERVGHFWDGHDEPPTGDPRAQWAASVQAYRQSIAVYQQAVATFKRRRHVARPAPVRSRQNPGLPQATQSTALLPAPRPTAPTEHELRAPAEPETTPNHSLPAAAAALVQEPGDTVLLTPRQQEVAALIARGYTNVQIATTLVLTKGTVANHVEAILRRLGCRSRTEVAVWALQQGADAAAPPRTDAAEPFDRTEERAV